MDFIYTVYAVCSPENAEIIGDIKYNCLGTFSSRDNALTRLQAFERENPPDDERFDAWFFHIVKTQLNKDVEYSVHEESVSIEKEFGETEWFQRDGIYTGKPVLKDNNFGVTEFDKIVDSLKQSRY